MLGGGMRQSGVLAAAGIVALRDRDRLGEDHRCAQRLADGLAGIAGIDVDPVEPRTNMVFFRVVTPYMDNRRFLAAAGARGVSMAELGHGRIRAVTHRGVAPEDIDYALEVIRSIREDNPEPTRRNHAGNGTALAR
jgi:threonine aldolase